MCAPGTVTGMPKILARLLLGVALGASSTVAAARARDFVFLDSPGYTIETKLGQVSAISETNSSVVVLRYSPSDRKRAWIHVTVKNKTDKPFMIAESSLEAFVGSTSLRVATQTQLLSEQSTREAWREAAIGVQAAVNSQAAAKEGYKTNSGTYRASTTISDNSGRTQATGTTTGTYSGTTYDPQAAKAAQERADKLSEQTAAHVAGISDAERSRISSKTLSPQFVQPGEVAGGYVRIDLPPKSKRQSDPLELRLRVGGENRSFLLREAD